jgi:hypothetical protein
MEHLGFDHTIASCEHFDQQNKKADPEGTAVIFRFAAESYSAKASKGIATSNQSA